MRCPACGASADRARVHCVICGHTIQPGAAKEWDRAAEATAYDDLRAALRDDEQLLGMTRGRIAGSWRQRAIAGPASMLSPYANLGLTGKRLIVQAVNGVSGGAMPGAPGSLPLEQVTDITAATAQGEPRQEDVRLVVTCQSGALRLRAVGRHGEGAQEMAEVWRSIAPESGDRGPGTPACPHCGRALERSSRFCPFCGKELPQ